jgi:hypothetical protein
MSRGKRSVLLRGEDEGYATLTDAPTDAQSDSDDETDRRKPVPNDIFDTLLSLVTPSERIQHDVKTRRNKGGDMKKERKRHNKTRWGGERLRSVN